MEASGPSADPGRTVLPSFWVRADSNSKVLFEKQSSMAQPSTLNLATLNPQGPVFLFFAFSLVFFFPDLKFRTACKRPMAHVASVSNLSRDLGDIDFLDGPRSSSDAQETDSDRSSARGDNNESATGSDSDGSGESLDSTYRMQSNPAAFYNYSDPSVISESAPHPEAPAQPVFGCVVERAVPLHNGLDASVAGMTRKRRSSSTTVPRFLLRQMRYAWTSFVWM